MRIVVISDIHSNLDALEAVARKLPTYDELYCLGDIVGYGPEPNEVVERLQELGPTVVLMGNHDDAVVRDNVEGFSTHAATAVKWTRRVISETNLGYLRELKPLAKVKRDGKTLALFHGSPRDPLSEYVYPGLPGRIVRGFVKKAEAQIVLLGHTHMPMLYRFNESILANPGSIGQPRDGDRRASFAMLSVTQSETKFQVHRVEYEVEPVAQKILKVGLPSFLAERLYMGV
jgi:putative phosphoesterase